MKPSKVAVKLKNDLELLKQNTTAVPGIHDSVFEPSNLKPRLDDK